MSRKIDESGRLKIAKYILGRLREIESERERDTALGNPVPELKLPLDKLIEDTGFGGKAAKIPSNEVIRGMFFKKGNWLIPELGIRSLTEFNDELQEQVKMYEGAFGRESLRRPKPRFVESGFVHNAARRK